MSVKKSTTPKSAKLEIKFKKAPKLKITLNAKRAKVPFSKRKKTA